QRISQFGFSIGGTEMRVGGEGEGTSLVRAWLQSRVKHATDLPLRKIRGWWESDATLLEERNEPVVERAGPRLLERLIQVAQPEHLDLVQQLLGDGLGGGRSHRVARRFPEV